MLVKTIALITERIFIPGQTACQLTLTPASMAAEEKCCLRANTIKTVQFYQDVEMSIGSFQTRVWKFLKILIYISFYLHSLLTQNFLEMILL